MVPDAKSFTGFIEKDKKNLLKNQQWKFMKPNFDILIHYTDQVWIHESRMQQGTKYNYLCNQCLSPLRFELEPHSWQGVLDTTLCDKICQWLAPGRWFSPGTPVFSTNKTDHQDITEILLKVMLNTTINLFKNNYCFIFIFCKKHIY